MILGTRRNTKIDQVRHTSVIQQNISRLCVPVNDILSMRITQGIGNQSDRPQYDLDVLARQHSDIRAIDVLQTVKGPLIGIVVFEYTNDVGMHQPGTKLPFIAKELAISSFVGQSG